MPSGVPFFLAKLVGEKISPTEQRILENFLIKICCFSKKITY